MEWYLQELIDDVVGYARRTALDGIRIVQDDDDFFDDVCFRSDGNALQGVATAVLGAFDGLSEGDLLRIGWLARDSRAWIVIETARGTCEPPAMPTALTEPPAGDRLDTLPDWVRQAGGDAWSEALMAPDGPVVGRRMVIGLPVHEVIADAEAALAVQ